MPTSILLFTEILASLSTQGEIRAYREHREIIVRGRNVPNPVFTFEEPGFSSSIFDTLMRQGFVEPTPIQAQGWPMALSGRDFVGIAQTGSGKTIGVGLLVMVIQCVCTMCVSWFDNKLFIPPSPNLTSTCCLLSLMSLTSLSCQGAMDPL